MSEENVEIVESVVAGITDMDKEALLAALPDLISQFADLDIEWVEEPQNVEGRICRGHDGVRQSIERWLEQWDELGTRLSGSWTAVTMCWSSVTNTDGE
jgi:hypothetical protein